VGFNPSLALYYGTSGSTLIFDNLGTAASNPWVSRSASNALSGGSVRLFVGAAGTQGVSAVKYASAADIPAYSTSAGGLFYGGALPPSLPVASSPTGSTAAYVYAFDVTALSSGTITIAVPEGTVLDTTGSFGNFPASVVLKLGFDAAPALYSAAAPGGTLLSPSAWLSAAGTSYLRVVATDGSTLGATSSSVAVSAALAVTSAPVQTFPAASLAATFTASGSTGYAEAALSLAGVTPSAYTFTLGDGVLTDANGAGCVAGTSLVIQVGWAMTLSLTEAGAALASTDYADPSKALLLLLSAPPL
jgi:hypothetical protein